jgi:hypothetical protein
MNEEIKNNRMTDVTIHRPEPDNTPLANQEVTVDTDQSSISVWHRSL